MFPEKKSRKNRKWPKSQTCQKLSFIPKKKVLLCSRGVLFFKSERPAAYCRKALWRWWYAQSEEHKHSNRYQALYRTDVSCVSDDAFGSCPFPGSSPQVSAGYSQDRVGLAQSSRPEMPCSLLPSRFTSAAFLPSFWLQQMTASLAAWVHSRFFFF